MSATPLVHTQFRMAVSDRIEHGTTDEQALASLLLSIYDASCEIPRVAHIVDEWALKVLS